MEEIGKIIEIKENTAIVRFEAKANCEGCKLCLLNDQEKTATIEVLNTIKAKKDDLVKIIIPEKMVLYSSFIIYIVPLLCLFAGYFLGKYFLSYFVSQLADSEVTGIIGSLLGLFISTFFLYRSEKKVKNNINLIPHISEIIQH